MKNFTLFIVSLLIATTGINAQSLTCDCKTDLDFVVEKIKKMPSYKKQIHGKKLEQFNNSYHDLTLQMNEPILVEACYRLLLEQMLILNDAHASLKFAKSYLSEEIKNNELALTNFKASDLFKNHPKTSFDTKVLKAELAQKTQNDLEGIYNYQGKEVIGVYYAENKKDLIGVVLETDLKHWETGDIRFYANHSNNLKYMFYFYNVDTRTPGLVESLTFENGRIWSYKKEGNTNNYELAENEAMVADFKQINENTQYLYFKTFANSKKKELIKFYNETADKLTAKNVIVDLRSNGGGNKKYSDPFLKLLKDKNVYVITNCFTGSNGEQFTLKLLKNKNAKHLGQTTRGIIAYGINYGYDYTTPSGNFKITPTDMNFHEYAPYEGKGISPEIPLNFYKDWIEQTLSIIATGQK